MEIQKFNPEIHSFEELIELFAVGLGDTDRSFWKWKYLTSNGFNKQIMYVIIDKGEIVAMMGFIPINYLDSDNKAHTFVQMCDLVVRPDYRGRGFYYKLYDNAVNELTALGCDAFMGPPNPKSLHVLEKKDYMITHMRNYSLGLSLKAIFLHKIGLGKNYKSKGKYSIEVVSKGLDAVCGILSGNRKLITQESIYVDINPEYITWKCEDYYKNKYKAVVVKDKEKVIAYFILLVTEGRRVTAAKVANFNIDKEYIEEFKPIANLVKKAFYSFADLVEFNGIWNTEIEQFIIQAFDIKEKNISQAGKFGIKMIENNELSRNDLFINHIDLDL